MIIEIKVANYRSINAEQTLSFVADRAARHPGNLIKRPGYRLLKAVGLFGANASGKSNLVKAVGAMSAFVRDSATKMNDGDPILAAEPYRLDPETRDKPSRFEITFVTNGTVYTYGFAADRQRVREEWLSAKTETSEKDLFNFHRNSAGSQESGECLWGSQLAPVGGLIFNRTRDNGLLLSTAARENVKELLPVYRYLSHLMRTHDVSSDVESLITYTASRCEEDEEFRRQVESLLNDADTGIETLSVRHEYSLKNIPSDMNSLTEPEAFYKARRAAVLLSPVQQIEALKRGNGQPLVEFDFIQDESNGTRRLFGLAGVFLDALATGRLLVIDELDASMHPLITRRLLEMFQSPEANLNGAQLLFTTHDAILLDSVLFRRDQIVLAEKCYGASTFFSLADIQPPIRNSESFLRNYLAGRYGGTPYLGRAFSLVNTAVDR